MAIGVKKEQAKRDATKPEKKKAKKSIISGKVKNRQSFRLVRKKEADHRPKIDGVFVLLRDAGKLLRSNWKAFLGLGLLYVVAYKILVDGLSRLNLDSLRNVADQVGVSGNWFGEIGVMTAAVFDMSSATTETGMLWANILLVMFGLFAIWAIRQTGAGHRVKIRDALYNGATGLPAVIVALIIIFFQTIPLLLGVYIYMVAESSGIITSGVELMVLFIVALLTSILTGYWLTSSIFGLITASLPGVYPINALRAASELVKGRRLKVFIRIIALVAAVFVFWLLVVMISVSNPVTGAILNEILAVLRVVTLFFVLAYLYRVYRSLIKTNE